MTADANLSSRPSGRPLIAPAWHTIVFIAIFVGLSVAGGFFQHAAKQHPQATVPSGNAVPRYIEFLFHLLEKLHSHNEAPVSRISTVLDILLPRQAGQVGPAVRYPDQVSD